MSERLAVYTTWYPGIERFLQPWHASLRAQTDRDFDLWIGADGVDAPRLLASLPADERPVRFYSRPGATPAQVREGAIGSCWMSTPRSSSSTATIGWSRRASRRPGRGSGATTSWAARCGSSTRTAATRGRGSAASG